MSQNVYICFVSRILSNIFQHLSISLTDDVIDPVIHSMGLKMEYNTRRFVIDDKRELQYRVEVQNRVYKKEIAALDAEIRRLERLLDSTNTPPTGSSTSSSASIIAAIQKVSLNVHTKFFASFAVFLKRHKKYR